MKRWCGWFLLFCFFVAKAYAQHEADNWLLNQHVGLNFTTGEPNLIQQTAKRSLQITSSISDKVGKLLFYTNGDTVWNRQHQVITNGTGLLGFKQALQNSIIIPKPGSNTLYYIFTQEYDSLGQFSGYSKNLRYSVVDMAAQNGLGEIVAGQKNVLLYTPPVYYMSRKLTAVHHANNRDIWLITHRFFNAYTHEFLVFKITPAGIATPVSSRIVTQTHDLNSYGSMKVSPKGKYLAAEFGYSSHVFRFNNKTGEITDLARLDYLGGTGRYHNAPMFSPDESKLYISVGSLLKYDLTSGIPTTILASRTVVNPPAQNPPEPHFGTIQLARNGKIYVARSIALNSSFITEIANPNAVGVACTVQPANLPSPLLGNIGFPNFIQSYFAPPRFTFTEACAGSPVTFAIADTTGGMRNPKWNFGDAASGNSNQSRSFAPDHSFTAAGTYNVTLTLFFDNDSAVFNRQIIIPEKPKVKLGADTILCTGKELILRNQVQDSLISENYRWSTGDTTATITVTKPGKYWLTLQDSLCPTTDSINVTFEPCLPPYLPNIITLNHDGKNETFQPLYFPKGIWQLQVFNRWGKQIFETDNYQNNWPQTDIPSGTYYYLFRDKNTNQKYKGWLEVVK